MENASLQHPLTCGFCNHANPANSRYCNACGAPLRVQPCPQCGSVNDATAATCQECGAALTDSGPNEFFLPLPPEAPADAPPSSRAGVAKTVARSPGLASVSMSVLLEERAAVAERHEHGHARASAAATARATEAPPVSGDDPKTTAAASLTADADADSRSSIAGSTPEPVAAAAAVSEFGAHSDQSSGGSGWRTVKSLVVLTVIGVGVFFAYRHFQRFQPSDAAPRPTASSENRVPVQPETTAPTATTAATGKATPPVAADGAGSKGSRSTEPARAAPAQPPADIFIVKPEPEKARPQPPAQEAQKAAAAPPQGDVKRSANSDRAATAPPASSPAGCPAGMAALGLCKP